MIIVPKQLLLALLIATITGCGEISTSDLSEAFPILRSGPNGMEFAFIPSDIFRMGYQGEEAERDSERNVYWVELTDDYWMQTTEVTRKQWREVMGSYPSEHGCFDVDGIIREDDHPVSCVTRSEIDRFFDRLNEQNKNDGYTYRRPTGAEWEHAARGYTDTPYSTKGPINSFAWYNRNSSLQTRPVAQLKANLFGLYDVHGNIAESVSNWYYSYPEVSRRSEAIKNPTGPSYQTNREVRGGAWDEDASDCRSISRLQFGNKEPFRRASAGLRVFRTIDK